MSMPDITSIANDEDSVVHDLCPFCKGDYSVQKDGSVRHSEPPCETYCKVDPKNFRALASRKIST
jgi:hypothetical protein